jgi:hypothetical protein
MLGVIRQQSCHTKLSYWFYQSVDIRKVRKRAKKGAPEYKNGTLPAEKNKVSLNTKPSKALYGYF